LLSLIVAPDRCLLRLLADRCLPWPLLHAEL
jgi:hypothetical protein